MLKRYLSGTKRVRFRLSMAMAMGTHGLGISQVRLCLWVTMDLEYYIQVDLTMDLEYLQVDLS